MQNATEILLFIAQGDLPHFFNVVFCRTDAPYLLKNDSKTTLVNSSKTRTGEPHLENDVVLNSFPSSLGCRNPSNVSRKGAESIARMSKENDKESVLGDSVDYDITCTFKHVKPFKNRPISDIQGELIKRRELLRSIESLARSVRNK